MAVIKSGATTDQLTVDATSKAAHTTPYHTDGTVLTTANGVNVTCIRPFKNTTWALNSTNSASAVTNTQAAAGVGVRNVCTAIIISVSTLGTAPTAATLTFNLRDGASGAGTVLWSQQIRVSATVNLFLSPIMLSGLWIEGTANTAMTLESSGAPGTNIQASICVSGTTI